MDLIIHVPPLRSTMAFCLHDGAPYPDISKQSGDPNSAQAPVLWPAWEGRQRRGYRDPAGAAAMAASLSRGGGLDLGMADTLGDTRLHRGGGAGGDALRVAMAGEQAEAAGRHESYFLQIKAQPEVQELQRDCLCEFWDRLKYRH